ncbi:MAG: DNA/RNA nuclease SfsA [Magnetococcales bacterium]|nr:DNA/RNA nuclease SfsA [Magnetococcales bacterium]
MRFQEPLIPGRLLKRYKRFLADVELPGGEILVAHCPNTGAMTGMAQPGTPVLLSHSNNPRRKLAHTWELAQVEKNWVVVNTGLANRVVAEGLAAGGIPELAGYPHQSREVRYDESRFDFCLTGGDRPSCYLEVKSVTLRQGEGAFFPDAVTERGLRHLETLVRVVQEGHRGVMLYLVQRADCRFFAPAITIDPAYAKGLQEAVKQGVEVVVRVCRVTPQGVALYRTIPFEMNPE